MNIRMDLIDIMIVKEVRRTERNCISSEGRIWIFGNFFLNIGRSLLSVWRFFVCWCYFSWMSLCEGVMLAGGDEEYEIKVVGLFSLMRSGTYINLDFIFILFEIYFFTTEAGMNHSGLEFNCYGLKMCNFAKRAM